MSRTRTGCDCDRLYPEFVDFCVSCGARLGFAIPDELESSASVGDCSYGPDEHFDGESGVEHIRGRLFAIVNGKRQDFGVEFSDDVIIGRFDGASDPVDVDLSGVPDAASIAPRHARLWLDEAGWSIEEIGAASKVFIAGKRLKGSGRLVNGEELCLGKARFVFETNFTKSSGSPDRMDGSTT